ncbi:MAG: ATP-dependent Clp protease proteolytic subunit [Acidimicrobiales bacterium]
MRPQALEAAVPARAGVEHPGHGVGQRLGRRPVADLPNAGQSTDMEIAVREMVDMRRLMIEILADCTGQTTERITRRHRPRRHPPRRGCRARRRVDHIVAPAGRRRPRSPPAPEAAIP